MSAANVGTGAHTAREWRVIYLPAQKGLDAITVLMQDAAPKCGRLIVECYGSAWSAYWGAMGDRTIAEFLRDCDPEYVAGKLYPSNARRNKSDEAYLVRIVEAVMSALPAHATGAAA
jgi:hypothetical protein